MVIQCFLLFFLVVDLTDARSILQANRLVLLQKSKTNQPPLFGGDIVLTPLQKKVIRRQDLLQSNPSAHLRAIAKEGKFFKRWNNNTAVYEISSAFNADEQKIIRNALSDLSRRTCFKIYERREKPDAVDYVKIDKNSGCYSAVGRVGGEQPISLGLGCVHDHIVKHEFMHSLGIGHEHQRPDRDVFLTIMKENVWSGFEYAFNRYEWNDFDTGNIPYSYKSIMHYEDTATAKKTMKQKYGDRPIKRNEFLNKSDFQKLAFLGNCPEYKDGVPPTQKQQKQRETSRKQKKSKKHNRSRGNRRKGNRRG
ncbi:Metalloendopeptidase [Aphelenchoides besseyi]|nr:Metalloendopeptidase [Aphelenchoides besseyi]